MYQLLYISSGDIILGTEEVDCNWWRGKSGPLRGIFPLSCVHELDVITEGPRSRSASLKSRSASFKVSVIIMTSVFFGYGSDIEEFSLRYVLEFDIVMKVQVRDLLPA